ncbi:hypothetical protein AMQ84_07430 [Paenibacillus riograndensis]|uniref:Uncharacterized protein n=1 Tax=Paenibacillus riograndensis TaxID=483937 RepID=A0A132U6W7_9BACL|nr:hypothetical protein [Paenibacillus riograndensis]KWX79198.1 hypothetical protein AMQ84_07430 [Paenibacillus riograndensis]
MENLESLSSAAILKSATAYGILQVKEAAASSEQKIREADTVSAAAILRAKVQATKLFNKSIDSIFLSDDRGIRICDALGKEQDQFQTPTSAYCMTVDPLNNKLYFIIETTAQPISINGGEPVRKLVEVTLFATSLRGTDIEELKKMQYNVPVGVTITGSLDIHPAEGKIIWISPAGTIQSMNVQGNELHELAKANFSPKTPAVHATLTSAGTLFWTALEKQTAAGNHYGIWKLEKDSTEIRKLISYPLPLADAHSVFPSRVQVDETAGKLYWNSYRKIEAMTLEGTDREVIYTSDSAITGLEIDPHLKRLYWLEQNHILVRSTLDGKNIEQAMRFEESEFTVKSLYIRTKSDEAAGILLAAQRARQLAAQKAAEDISTANKAAYAYLLPAQEAYQAAESAFKARIAPALKEAEDKLRPAKAQYMEQKSQADTQLANAKSERDKILLQARDEHKSKVAEAQTDADKKMEAATEKLDEARRNKKN